MIRCTQHIEMICVKNTIYSVKGDIVLFKRSQKIALIHIDFISSGWK